MRVLTRVSSLFALLVCVIFFAAAAPSNVADEAIAITTAEELIDYLCEEADPEMMSPEELGSFLDRKIDESEITLFMTCAGARNFARYYTTLCPFGSGPSPACTSLIYWNNYIRTFCGDVDKPDGPIVGEDPLPVGN